jgi:hypothetical protein
VRHDLNYIKWILLVFVIMEIVSLLVAFIMRCCVDPDGHYGDFADEEVGEPYTAVVCKRVHHHAALHVMRSSCSRQGLGVV